MSASVARVLAFADGRAAFHSGEAGALAEGDPFGGHRSTVFSDEQGFAAGLAAVSGRYDVAAYPFTETLVVHEGELSFTSNEQTIVLKAGDCLVIARGTAFALDASADGLWAWFAATRAEAAVVPGLTVVDRDLHLSPSAPPDDKILISRAPQCRAQGVFEEGPLRVGVWDSTAYERHSRGHLCHEFMHLTEGKVTLRLAGGEELVVHAGDTVFVAKGTSCGWLSTGYVRKYYAVT